MPQYGHNAVLAFSSSCNQSVISFGSKDFQAIKAVSVFAGRHRGIELHKPFAAHFTAYCAPISAVVVPATTASIGTQPTANCAAKGATQF